MQGVLCIVRCRHVGMFSRCWRGLALALDVLGDGLVDVMVMVGAGLSARPALLPPCLPAFFGMRKSKRGGEFQESW